MALLSSQRGSDPFQGFGGKLGQTAVRHGIRVVRVHSVWCSWVGAQNIVS